MAVLLAGFAAAAPHGMWGDEAAGIALADTLSWYKAHTAGAAAYVVAPSAAQRRGRRCCVCASVCVPQPVNRSCVFAKPACS